MSGEAAIDLWLGRFVEVTLPSHTLDPAQSHRSLVGEVMAAPVDQPFGICFARLQDGRGYSLAARLREVRPELALHAHGAVHEEMLYFLRRSGFRFAHPEARAGSVAQTRDLYQLQALLHPFSAHYQHAAGDEPPQGSGNQRFALGSTRWLPATLSTCLA